jgi:hypothetical protein
MNEVIGVCVSYPLIVGLTLCYAVGVPTPAQLKQLSRGLFKRWAADGCLH